MLARSSRGSFGSMTRPAPAGPVLWLLPVVADVGNFLSFVLLSSEFVYFIV